MTAALQSLQDQYDLLTSKLPDLLTACKGDSDKEDAINVQYATCEANYNNCLNKIFNDNDPRVQALVAQMKDEQTSINAAVQHLDEIEGVIKAITTAVQVGESLAAKV